MERMAQWISRNCAGVRLRVWLFALWTSVGTWISATVIMASPAFVGLPFSRAGLYAAISAAGGLFAWAIYHGISRRNDGLMIILVAPILTLVSASRSSLPPRTELIAQGVAIGFMALSAAPVALFLRRSRKRETVAIDSPVWDAEIDRG